MNNKNGYIDKTEKFVISPQFDVASSFSGGLAEVRLGDKSGYIDRTGKFVENINKSEFCLDGKYNTKCECNGRRRRFCFTVESIK